MRYLKHLPLVLLLGLGAVYQSQVISRAGSSHMVYGNDFTVFYAAGRNFLECADPYNHPISARTPYLYPPLFALLIAPLSLLSLPTAATIWYWLNLIFLAVLVRAAARYFAGSEMYAIVVLLLISRASIDNLWWGQVNILIALLILCWYIYRERAANLSAIFLALAISIKITPAIFVLYLLFKKGYQELARVAVAGLTLTSLSVLPLGVKAPELLIGWFRRTILNGEGFNWAYLGNQSLRACIARFFEASDTGSTIYPRVTLIDLGGTGAQTLFLICVISLLIFTAYRFKSSGLGSDREVAICVVLMLMLSNLSWKAHFIVMALPLACLLKAKSKLAKIALAIWTLLCLVPAAGVVERVLYEGAEVCSSFLLASGLIYATLIHTRQSTENTVK